MGLVFGTLELGGRLRILKDFRLEQCIVGVAGVQERGRALGMELQGCLKDFQGVIDLRVLPCVVDLLVDTLLWLDIDGRKGGLVEQELRLASLGYPLMEMSTVPCSPGANAAHVGIRVVALATRVG